MKRLRTFHLTYLLLRNLSAPCLCFCRSNPCNSLLLFSNLILDNSLLSFMQPYLSLSTTPSSTQPHPPSHNHTLLHTTTPSFAQPHHLSHNHTLFHTTTLSFTQPHSPSHNHTLLHTTTPFFTQPNPLKRNHILVGLNIIFFPQPHPLLRSCTLLSITNWCFFKVCLDREADMVFIPCGHICCCLECTKALRMCPICRKKIEKAVRTYTS